MSGGPQPKLPAVSQQNPLEPIRSHQSGGEKEWGPGGGGGSDGGGAGGGVGGGGEVNEDKEASSKSAVTLYANFIHFVFNEERSLSWSTANYSN